MARALLNVREELNESCSARNAQQRSPEILGSVDGIDEAGLTKSEGNPSEDHSQDEKDSSYTPAHPHRDIEELLSGNDVPADLQMHRQRSNENPNTRSQSSSDEESSSESAGKVREHIIRRDFVVALRWFRSQWYDKGKGHEKDSYDKTCAEIVSTSFLGW